MTESNELLERDAQNRCQALKTERSFIVQAPAGAGKTELLTQRFLALLSTVEQPEDIVALTFTKKAAAEMRERVFHSLEMAVHGQPPVLDHKKLTYALSQAVLQRDQAQGWNLLQQPERLQIITIDSLCGKLARQMPLLSRFGGQPAVSTDCRRYYQQAVSETLACLEDQTPLAEAVARVLAGFDNDVNRLSELLIRMLESRDQWLDRAFQHGLAQTEETVAAALAVLIGNAPDATILALAEKDFARIPDLIELLKACVAHLWLVFQEAQTVDFIQIAQNALEALGNDDAPTDLQLKLDYRIQHILVDEFQDTSPSQVALLEKLTAGWEPNDGRTLFCVGDPMQSIYRFRKADVSLFLQTKERGIGSVKLETLQLYRNNRSYRPIVDWVNATFPSILGDQDIPEKGAVRFSDAAPTRTGDGESSSKVVIHPFILATGEEVAEELAEGGDADPLEVQEAKQIITLLRELRRDRPNETIGVLVRAKTHLTSLVAEMRRNAPDLPYLAVEIENLAERQCVQDLVALVRALHHRADRVNWLAILRAPWCGLTLQDLHHLAADNHDATLWSLMHDASRLEKLSTDGQARLQHLRTVLAEAFAGQGRQRPRRWVEGVWKSLSGADCLEDAGALVDTQALFALLDRLTEHGQLALDRLDGELEKLFASPNPHAGNAIQMMTIHKSKGLEFDTVILPGLGRQARADSQPLLLWETVKCPDGAEHCLVASKGQADDSKKFSDLLWKQEKARADQEARRVLYVATTRAIRELHIFATAKYDANHQEYKIPGSALLYYLWDAVVEQFKEKHNVMRQAETAATAVASTPTVPFDGKLVRLKQVGYPESLQASGVEASRFEVAGDNSAPEATQSAQWEADIGTLTHRYLEMIADDHLDGWRSDSLPEHRVAMVKWFGRRGHDLSASQRAADEVLSMLQTVLNSETGRWILLPHAEAGCEIEFATADGEKSQKHAVDRSFVDQGVRWIIDYKTSKTDWDQADVASEQSGYYRSQLERYRQLYANDGLMIRCAVYLCRYDRLVVLT